MNANDPSGNDLPSSISDTTAALLRKAMALGVEPAPSVNETPPQPDTDVDMPSAIGSKSPGQCWQLALDIRAGLIFGSWCFPDADAQAEHYEAVFGPYARRPANAMFAYQYLTADPNAARRHNRYPLFYRAHYLTPQDATLINQYMRKQALDEGSVRSPQIKVPPVVVRKKPWWRVQWGRVTHWCRTQWWRLTDGHDPEDGS